MISILQKTSFITLLVGGVFFVGVQLSLAQEAISFSVSPTIFDMTANPTQTWRSTIRIINPNPFELAVSVSLVEFIPRGEGGTPQFIPLEESGSSTLARWITAEENIVIPAEKTIEYPFTISVPEDASPGGHFAALLISTSPPQSPTETVVATSQVISALVFLRVSGDINEESSIRSFRTTQSILSSPSANFEIRIENTGNVHIQPQGEIKIFNMWGQERGIIPINQKTLLGNILPESVRRFSFGWSGEWSLSDIGRYTAVTTLAYGVETRKFMSADTDFWVIPWQWLLGITAFIIGFILLLSWAIRAYVASMLSHTQFASEPVATQSTSELPKRKRATVSLTSPIENGILDLRAQLQETTTLSNGLAVLGTFISSYWKFFATAVMLMIFLICVGWFITEANKPNRDFAVMVEDENGVMQVSEDDALAKPFAPSADQFAIAPAIKLGSTTIRVEDRSGNRDEAKRVVQIIENAGYPVVPLGSSSKTPEPKTVILYEEEDVEISLAISKLLDGALMSSLSKDDTDEPREIIIYLGSDAVQEN